MRRVLVHGEVEWHATPRRLAVRVRRLATTQPDRAIERRGPPVAAAFDSSGTPTQAALAFARGAGRRRRRTCASRDAEGHLAGASRRSAGRRGVQFCFPGIVRASLDALPIARRMRWGAGDTEFVRPVHWVLDAAWDERRRMRDPRHARGADEPGTSLHGASGAQDRKRCRIPCRRWSGAAAFSPISSAAASWSGLASGKPLRGCGGEAVIDEHLLDEVTALVEWPVALAGRFESRFLELPEDVPIATMQDHQRYFPVRDAQGRLMPWFVTVANIESNDPAQVIAGNERVIRPRLADAAFFYARISSSRWPRGARLLKRVTFQARLGSLHDKTERVRALAETIAVSIGGDARLAARAAELAKCDLLTSLVGEFPELQGVMGRYYALHDGEPGEVCEAIREQYLPRFAGDALPETRTGMALAIADKLDTIAGIFAIGQRPSGTRDPFGLRRAALGLLRISIERRLDLDLSALIGKSLAGMPFPVQSPARARCTTTFSSACAPITSKAEPRLA
jgi:glycyl-tRNA synthetase beta chain